MRKVGKKRFKKDVLILCLLMLKPYFYASYYKEAIIDQLVRMKRYDYQDREELMERINSLDGERFSSYRFHVDDFFVRLR